MGITFKDLEQFEEMMAERGLTQSKLAKLANVTQPYLSQTINGIKNPGVRFCEKICAALNVNFQDVFAIDSGYSFKNHEENEPMCFIPIVAKRLGLVESIVIQYIFDQKDNHKLDGKNYFNGHIWVPIKESQWKDLFPFLSDKEVINTRKTLIDNGILIQEHDYYRIDSDVFGNIFNDQ